MAPARKEWVVAVASYRRAGGVTTDRVFKDCQIVVPESQYRDYADHQYANGATIVKIPDRSDGNLCRKRNWIMDRWPGNLLILDDDYAYVGRVEGRGEHEAHGR